MQSLCAIAHSDCNLAAAYACEEAFQTALRLGLPQADLTEIYRRPPFKIIARNQDDHTKNFAFLMGRGGSWRLAPAYGLNLANQPVHHHDSICTPQLQPLD